MRLIRILLVLILVTQTTASVGLEEGRWGHRHEKENFIKDFSGLVNKAEEAAAVADLPGGQAGFLKIPKMRQISPAYLADIGAPDLTSDGKHILFYTPEMGVPEKAKPRAICIMDIEEQHPRVILRGGRDPAISPDGRYLAYIGFPGGGNNAVFIVRLADLSAVPDDKAGDKAGMKELFRRITAFDPSWSPDGRFVVCSRGHDYKIGYIRIDESPLQFKPLFGLKGRHAVLSPDQSVLAYVGAEGSKIYLYYLNEKRQERLTKFTGMELTPSFSPDGEWLAWVHYVDKDGDGKYHFAKEPRQLWVTHVRTRRHFTLGAAKVKEPCWSPDGRYIYGTFTNPKIPWDALVEITLPELLLPKQHPAETPRADSSPSEKPSASPATKWL